ncbi:MAG: CotH kinase family protein, partial [Fibromonadales bacterium]|nr:CotH kinase family protein [Fibromonadales bacterium]
MNSTLKSTLTAVICLSVLSLAALPELKVSTKNGATINSPAANLYSQSQQTANNCQNHLIFVHKYVPTTTITLSGAANPAHNFSVSSGKDSIRGRGNSTWAGDKKPYRIRFDSAQSVFGSKKHKSWALLANWYDQTFALNAVGFELGKRVGIPGTPNQYLVDLTINDKYMGIYQITDIVHVNKGRLEIDEKEGWLAEFDYHCPSTADEVDFATDYPTSPNGSKLHTFIKSPEDLPSSSGYDFVKKDLNNLTGAMFNKSGFPDNGYRDLVDLESVAKYLMLEQFLDNFDFNNKSGNGVPGFPASNFFHKDKGCKIKAGPIWDLDLIAGVEYNSFP